MSQCKYVQKILERFHMLDCKPRATPCEQKLDYSDDAEEMRDVTKYREAAGSLIYLATGQLLFSLSHLLPGNLSVSSGARSPRCKNLFQLVSPGEAF